MIKKIALILAPSERAYFTSFNMPPLSIGVVQGYLKEKGFEVNAVDLNVSLKNRLSEIHREEWLPLYNKEFVIQNLQNWQESKLTSFIDSLLKDINPEDVDIFGISIGSNFSFFEIHSALLIAKRLKDLFQKTIVFGGDNIQYLIHFKREFKELWRIMGENFKYFFVGPGEISFVNLIHILNRTKTEHKYEDLPGAVIVTTKDIFYNPLDTPSIFRPSFSGLDLDTYKLCLLKDSLKAKKLNENFFYKWPFPHSILVSDNHRENLPKHEKEDKLFIPYIFNYNCPFKCAFCVQSSEDKKGVISKDPVSVVNDIEYLIKEYDTKYFYFFNNTFNFSNRFVIEFCHLVEERGLEFYWSDCARFNNLDKSLLESMYNAGCRKLVFGFETGSPKILRLIDKRLDLDHARWVLRWCKEVGIWAEIEIIIGLPYEFEEDFQKTYSFVEENFDYISSFTLNKYFVVPSSLLGRYPERYGIKLIRIKNRYVELLKENAGLFQNAKDARDERGSVSNFQMYRYSELKGRMYKEIIRDTQTKVRRMNVLYNKLKIMDEIRLFTLIRKAKEKN